MTDHPTDPARNYANEAAELDDQLDATLREIRNRADTQQISIREAADLRVAALERHVEAIRRLRAEFYPEGDTTP